MVGTFLGILGIILTISFGGYSIWVYNKSKRNISLEFLNKECYSLFREDVNRLNIELIYNKTPLNNTLILLKAKLINNGHIDIDKNRIYSPLKIKSSESYKWLEATVTESPSGVNTIIEVLNEQEIQLSWDLLKKSEYIEIEALVEVISELEKDGEKGNDFYNDISFDYRITDLNSIQKEKQISDAIKLRTVMQKMYKFLGIITIVLGLYFLSIEFFPTFKFMDDRKVVNYVIENNNKESHSVISTNNKSDNIILFVEGEEKEREISVKEFNQNYEIKKIEKTITDPKNNLLNRTLGILYLLLGVSILIIKRILKRVKNRVQ
jgi:hypothetical protein